MGACVAFFTDALQRFSPGGHLAIPRGNACMAARGQRVVCRDDRGLSPGYIDAISISR